MTAAVKQHTTTDGYMTLENVFHAKHKIIIGEDLKINKGYNKCTCSGLMVVARLMNVMVI